MSVSDRAQCRLAFDETLRRFADMREPARRLNDLEFAVEQETRTLVDALSERDRAALLAHRATDPGARGLHRAVVRALDAMETLSRAIDLGIAEPMTPTRLRRFIKAQLPGVRVTRAQR